MTEDHRPLPAMPEPDYRADTVAAAEATPAATIEKSSRGLLAGGAILLLAMSVAAIAMYAYAARATADRDPWIYAQIGKEILAGKRLYTETWIDKPPVALLMYTAPQIVAPRSYRAIVIWCALVIVAQGLLFAWAFRQSLAAAVACAIFMIFYPLEDGTFTWPSTEHFANLFVTGNVLIALAMTRSRSFSTAQCLGAGALAIAAFHVRQNTVLCGLLPVLAVLLSGRNWRECMRGGVLMVGGGLVTWTVILALVAWLGDVRGYFWALFVYPRIFASLGTSGDLMALVKHFAGSTLAILLLIFGLLTAEGRYLWLTVATIVIGVGGCLVAMHNHPHYLANTLPYIALLVGLGTVRLKQLGQIVPWLSTATMAIILFPAAYKRMEIVNAEPTSLALEQVAAEVDRMAPADATLWVCGPIPSEAIQFTSRLPAANTHCWVFQMRSPWKELLPKPWATIVAEYLANPPGVIVVHEGLLEEAQKRGAPRREERADPSASVPEYLQLLQQLLAAHHYENVAVSDKYVVLLRER